MRPIRALVALQQATVTPLCAVWLVVLAALPFTAPFASLDAADLFGGGDAHTTATRVAAPTSTPAQDNNDTDDVAASEAAFQRVHPTALCGLVPVASPEAVCSPPSVEGTLAIAPATSLLHDASDLLLALRL
jgi:hypothetical protein